MHNNTVRCNAEVPLSILTTVAAAILLPVSSVDGQPRTQRVGPEVAVGGFTREDSAAQQFILSRELLEVMPKHAGRNPISVALTEQNRADLAAPTPSGQPMLIGVVKQIEPTLRVTRGQFEQGATERGPDGTSVWATTISSPEAAAIRVHFTDFSLPVGVEMFFYNTVGEADGPYTGTGRNGNGDFWTRSVSSNTAVIQLRFGKSTPRSALRSISFTVSELAHIHASNNPSGGGRTVADNDTWPCGNNPACFVDANCVNGTPADPAKDAIAKMEWIEGPSVVSCTGGLLADTDTTTHIPYFLTANHCVSSSNSNLETWFNYATSSCNGDCPHNRFGGGAPPSDTIGFTVVATSATSDFTLATLDQPPPAGALFLGWNNSPVAFTDNVPLHRISNANFGPQVYSQQDVDSAWAACGGLPRGDFIYSGQNTGGVRGGSSGSPVVNAASEVVGQLFGCCGTSCTNFCDTTNNRIVDGAFAATWPLVEEFLDPPGPPCASDSDCDDGLFCTGPETCDIPSGVCQPATLAICDDGVGCTNDSCNEGTDSCDNIPSDGLCDDGLFCNGPETCNATLDCQNGTAPNCDDNIACTSDACSNGASSCVHVPDHMLCCDGLLCNGVETCDQDLGCQAVAPPSCDDGVACTEDSCNVLTDQCDHLPNDTLCDDGLFCNGAETCDHRLDCQAGNVPCANCDEPADACADCTDNQQCDDGQICNGAETCVGGACQAGPPINCDDGIPCTDNICNPNGTCSYPSNSIPCCGTNCVLMLVTTLSDASTDPEVNTSLEVEKVNGLGLNPVLVTAEQWQSIPAADFATYTAIILGDWRGNSEGTYVPAEATTDKWGPAVTGNVIIIGTDVANHSNGPFFHPGAALLAERGIAFATAEPGRTGAYITVSNLYQDVPPFTPAPLLDAFGPGGFTATGVVGCFNDIHIVGTHPALGGLTDADLSGWECSAHEAFDSWPIEFQVFAIAKTGCNYRATEGFLGTPYILGRGLTVISDIDLAPLTATNPIGTPHTITASVVEDGLPLPGALVTFTVIAGPHVGTTDTDVTDVNGEAFFTYTATGEGTDTIRAQFVDVNGMTQTSNTVTKTWEQVPGEPPICDANGPYAAECQGATTTVALDGTGSSDPDLDPLTYSWSSDCPAATFDDPTSSTPILTLDSVAPFPPACNVTLTVVAGGQSDTCSSQVTINDNTPPTIGCPADLRVQCRAEVPTPDTTSVSASDGCGTATVTHIADVSDALTCPETITRTYRATDASGNFADCQQIITVNDDTNPAINCPIDVTVQCSLDVPAPDTASVSASDNCGTHTVTHVGDASDGFTCPETITRTYRATDACGNTTECQQIITVNDDTSPAITCPADVSVQCNTDVPAPDTTSVSASDNCSTATVTHVDDVSDGLTCPETITRTYRATDGCGNAADCPQTIVVDNTTPPVITCPADITIEAGQSTDPSATGTASAVGTCDPASAVSFVDIVTTPGCLADPTSSTIERTWTANGTCGGNSAACVQTITVLKIVANLDIKPGACPNRFNRSSNGVLPTSLMGTPGFDVAMVDLSSVRLSRGDCGGGAAGVAPHEGPPGPKSSIGPGGRPFAGVPCDCQRGGQDGIDDLNMKFKSADLTEVLQLDSFPNAQEIELVVTGVLLGTGIPFIASDCVKFVPPGSPPGLVSVDSNICGPWIDTDLLDQQVDGGGFGTFTRSYDLATVVTFTAELIPPAPPFVEWRVDGTPQTPGDPVVAVSATTADIQLEAVFEPQCCDPVTDGWTPIDDGDPCTADTCQIDGTVTHTSNANPGTDFNGCLVDILDFCIPGVDVDAVIADGCTVIEQLSECYVELKNGGGLASCMAQFAQDLKDAGLIPQVGTVQNCVTTQLNALVALISGGQCSGGPGGPAALLRALPPHDILKNRYISFDPRGAVGNNPSNLHIRVMVDSSEASGLNGTGPWWAGQPNAGCISIVTSTKPAVEPDWTGCDTAHLSGCPIIPTTAYAIVAESDGLLSGPGLERFSQCFDGLFPMSLQVVCDPGNGDADCTSIPCNSNSECPFGKTPCDGGFCSNTANGTCEQSLLRTQLKPGGKWHGDVVGFFTGTEWTAPNGEVSIDDTVAAIKTFQNPSATFGCGTPPCNATHVSVTDMVPNLTPGPQINLIVNIDDVLAIILGFQGQEYPGSDLTQCP